jgi:ubiquinone/menaquinone biosynthesis C-methylase UbiE/glycosyltransferase involved in cell wall biosynthesis
MVKITLIVPTYREGGMDRLFGSLKNQTVKDYELILVDQLYEWRKREVAEYADRLNIPLVHIPEKPKPKEHVFGESNAWNTGLLWAEGDYVMFGQDFIWLEPDCFERHLKIQKPEGRITVGYMPHYVSWPLKDLKGKITVFDQIHEERPQLLELPDRRFHSLEAAPDLGEDYARLRFHYHLVHHSIFPNVTIPLHALIQLNGFDERLDIGHGFQDDLVVFKLVHLLNYEVVLDKKNFMLHITHPWSRKQQHPQQAITYYSIINSILQGFAGIKAPNGYDLIQERCRVRYERWLKQSGGVEKPPLTSTYQQPPQQQRLKWIKEQCSGAESILELGCSSGYVLLNVAENAQTLAGMDINEAVIEKNKEEHPNVKWVHGDVTKLPLPFPDNSYTCVLLTEVLEHIPWSSVSPLIMDAVRVSSKKVVITIPNAAIPKYNRRYVESEHHQWALTLERLYALSLTFLPGTWTPKPNFAIQLSYYMDENFVYFTLEKIPTIEAKDEVFERAVKLKEMKEAEARKLMGVIT